LWISTPKAFLCIRKYEWVCCLLHSSKSLLIWFPSSPGLLFTLGCLPPPIADL